MSARVPRPFQAGTTKEEFESLMAIAASMGCKQPRRGPRSEVGPVHALIRHIARGEIVLAWKAEVNMSSQDPEPDVDEEELPEPD